MGTPTKLGKYTVDATPLGQGAMGVVYKGFDPDLRQAVAIKVIRRELVDGPGGEQMRQRFKNEAIAGRRLRHPNIVPVYEYGEDDDCSYIVMAFVEGRPLKEALDTGQRSSVPEALDITGQLLDALQHAHHNYVVHRDIKPANLLVGEDGQLQIADFGIAKIDLAGLTRTGAIMGTPAYMSPEQCLGTPSDHRADIFAAGVILYQLLTGEQPFQGNAPLAVMQQVLTLDPVRPSQLNLDVSPALDVVVAKAMAKRREERFQSAREFAEALKEAAEPRPARAEGIRSAPTITGTVFERRDQAPRRTPPETLSNTGSVTGRSWLAAAVPAVAAVGPSRARVPVFLWAVVVLLLLAGLGLWYWDAFHRQHIEYYANVIKRWGLPEGVGRLTDEQVRHRNVTLVFIKHGRWGVVQEVRAVNARGAYPPALTYFPPLSLVGLNPLAGEVAELLALSRVTFTRDANGQILKQSAYNRSDRLLYTLHYAQPDVAEYKEGAFSKPSATGITHIKFMRPETGAEAGLDKELLYFDGTDTPKADVSGSYGVRFTFSAFGQPVEETSLGVDRQPAVSRGGTERKTFTFDGQGNLTRDANYGPHDQPVLSFMSGSAERKMRYDQYGNMTEVAFFGTEGQLVTFKGLGAAGRTITYDDDGNPVESTFFGPDRQLRRRAIIT
jgi:predicted Ser/Thr protein kinase